MNLETLDKWAKKKGILVLGTGDFTHPEWLKELREKLKEKEDGTFVLKEDGSGTRFLLTSEISCVYSQMGRLRKVHLILLSPSFEIAEKINQRLSLYGNLNSDGRPTLSLSAKDALKIMLDISEWILVVPAHIYTPWFSLFGSRSGFNSLEECFGEYSRYIFSIETGLSSDPPMSWRNSSLDRLTIISNSDSHSPSKIGREANVFNCNPDYFSIVKAIKEKDHNAILYTIEFFPEEGKYHLDGHRNCNISLTPRETKKYFGICPVCKKNLTIGVLHRIEDLADRPEGFTPEGTIPYKNIIPLDEIIAEALGKEPNAPSVREEYERWIRKFDNEFNVLLEVSPEDLYSFGPEKIAEGIIRARNGMVFKKAGYDGVYGKITVFGEEKNDSPRVQQSLF